MKARTNQLQAFALPALTVSKRVLPAHGHKFAPKTDTQPQLLACLLLKEHLRLDYRGAQDLLELSDGLSAALSLRQAPDHSTLWWFAQHKVTPELLQQALEETVGIDDVQRAEAALRRAARLGQRLHPPAGSLDEQLHAGADA